MIMIMMPIMMMIIIIMKIIIIIMTKIIIIMIVMTIIIMLLKKQYPYEKTISSRNDNLWFTTYLEFEILIFSSLFLPYN